MSFYDIALQRAIDPNWDIKSLRETGAPAGNTANEHFVMTYLPTGQRFFVKKDLLGEGVNQGDPNAARDQDIDAAELFRGAGMHGLAHTIPHSEDSVVIQQRVGDALELRDRPRDAGEISYRGAPAPRPGDPELGDVTRGQLGHLANPTDVLRMFMGDLLIGNYDRHEGNFQMGQDVDGHWWLFPIDNAMSGRNTGARYNGLYGLREQLATDSTPTNDDVRTAVTERLQGVIGSGNNWWYKEALKSLVEQLGMTQARLVLSGMIGDFTAAANAGQFRDPQLQGRLQFALEQLGKPGIVDAMLEHIALGWRAP
jgi:hypothetical protein